MYSGSIGYAVMENMIVRTGEKPAELAIRGLIWASKSTPYLGLLLLQAGKDSLPMQGSMA